MLNTILVSYIHEQKEEKDYIFLWRESPISNESYKVNLQKWKEEKEKEKKEKPSPPLNKKYKTKKKIQFGITVNKSGTCFLLPLSCCCF